MKIFPIQEANKDQIQITYLKKTYSASYWTEETSVIRKSDSDNKQKDYLTTKTWVSGVLCI